jgi:hypothetical protein
VPTPNDSLFFIPLAVKQGQQWYVSPMGTSAGDGSIDKPWDMQTALSMPITIKPGDTIWIKGGTYQAPLDNSQARVYTNRLRGTATAPIIVRAALGERVTIQGGINDAITAPLSSHTWYWGLEITSTTTRLNTPAERPGGINLYGAGNRVINCVIHDAGHPGVGFWNSVGMAA